MAKREGAEHAPLRPGPGLIPEEVAADQRRRLQRALVELVNERGYGGATVRDLLARAHVSRPTFYELFAGKEDCFASVYEQATSATLSRIARETEGCEEGTELAAKAVGAFCETMKLHPATAMLTMLEPLSVGPGGRSRMWRTEAEFALLIQRRMREAAGVELPTAVALGLVAGVAGNACRYLARSEPAGLSGVDSDLVSWFMAIAHPRVVEVPRAAVPLSPPGSRTPPAPYPPSLRGEDERTLILNAALRLASERGFAQLTPQSIAVAAGIPTRRFEHHFPTVEDCFAQVVQVAALGVILVGQRAFDAAADWMLGVRAALAALCNYLAAHPDVARLLFVEVFAPGDRAVRQSVGILQSVADLLLQRTEEGNLSKPGATASVWAGFVVIRRTVRTGQPQKLPGLAPLLVWFALSPSIGAERTLELLNRD